MIHHLLTVGAAGETVFRYPWFAALIPLVVAVVTGALSVRAIRNGWPFRSRLVFSLLTLLALVAAPAIALERVVVTSESIWQTTGLGFVTKGFVFAEVDYVRIEQTRNHRGIARDLWHVHYRNGKVASVDPGDLWESNTDRIQPLLEGFGVRFR